MAQLGHAPDQLLYDIARQIANAEHQGDKMVTMHWLMLRHSAELQNMRGDDFCHRVGLKPSFKTEFYKMIKLGQLMRQQGFEISQK